MLQKLLLVPLLLALADARAAQEHSQTSNALDRVTIDVAGDGKQPMVVEVELPPPPVQLHYNVTTGDGPVVIDLNPPMETMEGQVKSRQVNKWKRLRMFSGSRDGRSAFPAQSVPPMEPPASFLTSKILHCKHQGYCIRQCEL